MAKEYQIVENVETFQLAFERVRKAQEKFSHYTQEQVDEMTKTAQYNDLLISRGQEKLAELKKDFSYTGQVEPTINYIFEKDYFLGDIIEIINEFGTGIAARITEIIESWDENGYTLVPTFSTEEVWKWV